MTRRKKSGHSDEGDVLSEINTTPLIDVMLVLLIMLIITIPIQTHSIKMDMPVGQPPQTIVEPVVIQLDVDFDGTVLWNGAELRGHEDLDDHLRSVAAQADQPEVHLRPNKLAKYANVAAVMAAAQRLGVTKIGLVGQEQFL